MAPSGAAAQHGDIGYHYDPTCTISATRAYDPLGAVIAETGTLTPLGYQGDYTNTAGDIWMGARWYQPGTGTFTSRDTVFGQFQTPISLNRYTYALADPLGRWDPDGRDSCNILTWDNWEEWADNGGTVGCAADKIQDVKQDVDVIVDAPAAAVRADVGATVMVAEGAWDRVSTFANYQYDSGRRRAANPLQSAWDDLTGTTFIEQFSAAEAI